MAVLRVYVDNIHQLNKVEKTLEALGETKSVQGRQISKNLLLTQGEAILSAGSNLNTWRCLGPYLLTLFAHSSSTRISGRSNSKRFSLFNLSALFHHSHKIMRVRMTSHKSQSQFRIICISNMLLQLHPFDNMAMPMLALSIFIFNPAPSRCGWLCSNISVI